MSLHFVGCQSSDLLHCYITSLSRKSNTLIGVLKWTPSACLFRNIYLWHPEWRSGLMHCIAVFCGVTTAFGRFPGCVTTGCDWESHRDTIGPASARLEEGLARGALLGSSRSSDFLWRAGRLQADFVSRTVFPPKHWLSERVLRSAVWRVMFRRTHDSPEPVGELQR